MSPLIYLPGRKSVPSSAIFSPKTIQSQVSSGGLKDVLVTLEKEKKQTIEKWDKAIAAVEAITPRDVNVSVSFMAAEDDQKAFEKEVTTATEKVLQKASMAVRKRNKTREVKRTRRLPTRSPRSPLAAPLVGHQRTVLKAFSKKGTTGLPDLVKRTKLERSHVAGILTILTRRGFAKRVGRGKYVRAKSR